MQYFLKQKDDLSIEVRPLTGTIEMIIQQGGKEQYLYIEPFGFQQLLKATHVAVSNLVQENVEYNRVARLTPGDAVRESKFEEHLQYVKEAPAREKVALDILGGIL